MELPGDGKLVRDEIPNLIRAAGEHPNVVILELELLALALEQKLLEEVYEFIEADPDGRPEELADILEVLHALAEAHGLEWRELEEIARVKRSTNGAFLHRVWLTGVD